MVTAEAVATFAEVAQGEALGLPKSSAGDTERIKIEGKRHEGQNEVGGEEREAECLGRNRDRSMVEAARLRAELVQVRKEKEIIKEDIEWLSEELNKARSDELFPRPAFGVARTQKLMLDAERFKTRLERLRAEKARLEGEEESMCKAIENSVQETKSLREELDQLRTETIM